MSHRVFKMFVSGAAAIVVGNGAMAAPIAPGDGPEVEISANVDGDVTVEMLAGTNIGGNLYSYSASTTGATYQIDWNMLINHDAGAGVENGLEVFSTSVSITNMGGAASAFTLGNVFNVALAGNPVLYGGSFSGSLTGGADGGMLSDVGGEALWAAVLSGTAFHSFYDTGFDFSTDPFGTTEIPPMAFGEPIPDLAGPDAMTMGTSFSFALGAGSTVSMASTFVAQVPAPGSLALLAIGILSVRRRRRT